MMTDTSSAMAAIIDANINRLAEGLRAIEEYTRFVAKNKALTDQLADLRHCIRQHPCNHVAHLSARRTGQDQRAAEPPPKRTDWTALLRANFSRVTEACRVLEEYTNATLFTEVRYAVYVLEKTIVLNLLKPTLSRGVYVIADTADPLLKAAAEGACMIQLRDKHAEKRTLLERTQALMAQKPPIPVIVNDHVDIAIACDADGLHTGQDDLPLEIIRDQLGPHKLIGRTCHSVAQAKAAEAAGADYVSLGPIYETPSKPGRPGIGPDALEDAQQLRIPFVVIGGINQDTLSSILAYNPPMIGVIRDHAHVRELTRQLLT
jgi:thiamine-phosphate pyrophosphorylase